jgi:hypothetical protein
MSFKIQESTSAYHVVIDIPKDLPELQDRNHHIKTCISNIGGLIRIASNIAEFKSDSLMNDVLNAAKDGFESIALDLRILAHAYKALECHTNKKEKIYEIE